MNGGDKKGYFSDLNGVVKDYWPGGMGVAGMCGCGLTKSCADPQKNVRVANTNTVKQYSLSNLTPVKSVSLCYPTLISILF